MTRLAGAALLCLLAAACGGTAEPTATFTGDGCRYEGPTEFDTDAEVTFTFVNDSDVDDPGFSIASVPVGTTSDLIGDVGIDRVISEDESFIGWVGNMTPPGTENTVTVTFTEPGTVALVCFAETGNGDGAVDYGNIVTVSG